MRSPRSHPKTSLRSAAIAGIVGPLILLIALVVLTLAQYSFMRSLRWHPLTAPTTDWPSGLALGPYGGWMTATFVVCGLLLFIFAQGLRAALDGNRDARWGATLLAMAGGAMVALSSPTDPTYGGGPHTLPGRVHDSAFAVLGLSFCLALLFLARAFRSTPGWASYAVGTWLLAALIVPAFVLKGFLFYAFLLAVIVWCEAVAIKLWRLSRVKYII